MAKLESRQRVARSKRQEESPRQKTFTREKPSGPTQKTGETGHILLGNDFSRTTFERHAALLGDSRMSQPVGARQRTAIARQLQRNYGNSYVQRLVDHISRTRAKGGQAKLTVGPAGDKYEQEADRVAKQVVGSLPSLGEAATQRQSVDDEELQMKPLQRQEDDEELQMKPLQRQEDDEELQMNPLQRQEDEEEMMQMKPLQRKISAEGGEVDAAFEQTIEGSRGHGQPLPDALRSSMEGAFGADFSEVRVHTGLEADALNQSISARAFTTGQDIFVGRQDYNPGSASGKELLAHELTHVVQQKGGRVGRITDKRAVRRESTPDSRSGDVRRKMNFDPKQLSGMVSTRAKIKGALGDESTFSKIRKVLADYKSASNADTEVGLLYTLRALAQVWLDKHGKSKSKASIKKAALLKQLLSAAEAETHVAIKQINDNALKQQKYMEDVEKSASGKSDTFEYLSLAGRQFVPAQAEGLARGETNDVGGQKEAALELVKKYNLTVAELAAIKIYTVDDFKYINSALAGDEDWLKSKIPDLVGSKRKDVDKEGLEKAKEVRCTPW